MGQILRLGPLLPFALVSLAALTTRHEHWRGRARRAAALALLAAGVIHLGLTAEHFRESTAAGAFFVLSSAAEVGVGAILFARRSSATARAALGVVGVLVFVYVAARLVRLPLTGGREDVDALGLVTKALEVVAALALVGAESRRTRRPAIAPGLLAAAALGAVALAARPLFGEGPRPLEAVVSVAAAVAVSTLGFGPGGAARPPVLVDGAVVALLLRAPSLATYAAVAAVTALARLATARQGRWVWAPRAVALAGALALGPLHTRLQILHVGHAAEPSAALVVFALSLVLAVEAWRRAQLPLLASFLAAHLGGQALRLAAGQTSFEAVEVPAASLGLALIASVVLADPVLRAAPNVLTALGAAAGALDVVLRELAVPYAPILAVMVVTALSGVVRFWIGRPPAISATLGAPR